MLCFKREKYFPNFSVIKLMKNFVDEYSRDGEAEELLNEMLLIKNFQLSVTQKSL